jgi:hypothetical protein
MKTNSDNSEIIGLCHVGIHDPEGNMADVFGVSAAISGSRVIVGARGDNIGAAQAGSAYVYDISNAAPRVPMIVLTNPGPAADDTAANDSGAAYIFGLRPALSISPATTNVSRLYRLLQP